MRCIFKKLLKVKKHEHNVLFKCHYKILSDHYIYIHT